MKVLYLSDLDGTLIRSDEKISEYTVATVNRFVHDGGCFSYATARSIITAAKITAGLDAAFPVICYNGALIMDHKAHEPMQTNFVTPDEAEYVRDALTRRGVFPIVYAYIDGRERFSYIERYVTGAMRFFLESRAGDIRSRRVDNIDKLYTGDIFNFACMDTEASLAPVDHIFKNDSRYSCIYQKDIYSRAQWCEILPAKATKANAALQLKEILNCDRLVVFGDGRNDMSLFSIADACYAMANAVPELKAMATAVIGGNDEDGVARWLEENVL